MIFEIKICHKMPKSLTFDEVAAEKMLIGRRQLIRYSISSFLFVTLALDTRIKEK
jgi:hypothetical protein